MKKINNALENAGGKVISEDMEQGEVLPASNSPSVGKFADAESLLKAYNQLESEFTKRSQRLRELEREVAAKHEQSADRVESEVVQDETGSAAEERTISDSDCIDGDVDLASEVERFLSYNPEAAEFADEIVAKAQLLGGTESGFLDRAYVGVLKDMLYRERNKVNDEFVLDYAVNSKNVRDEIIRNYLADIYSAKRETLLTGSGGNVAIAPPIKPSSIAEAGKMAVSVLRKK